MESGKLPTPGETGADQAIRIRRGWHARAVNGARLRLRRSTTFRGTIVADTIRGTFATRNAGTLVSEGAWRVVRRPTSR
jgi:hypothetical protein